MVEERKITTEADMEKHPDLMKAYLNYMEYVKKIHALGVQDFPAEEELRMMEYMDAKGKLQVAKGINAKGKKSLFISQ